MLLPLMLWFIINLVNIYDKSYFEIVNFLTTQPSKFLIGITWSFSFQMLSEIRHLIMDLGYGFELQTTRITGLLVIFGSIILTILIYIIGRGLI